MTSDPATEPRRRTLRDLIVQGIVLFVLLIIMYPGVFLRGEYTSSADLLFLVAPWSDYAPEGFAIPNNPIMVDIIAAFRPYYSVSRAATDEGVWPLWNPYQYMGVPLMANCQSAVFYPSRLIHAFVDLDLATTIFFISKIWICGMTAFICARGIGLAIWPSRFLSIAWMLCGYNVIWCYWPLTDVAAWLPIVFLGVESALQQKYVRGAFTLGIGGTLLLYAGHPETAFTMGLGVGIYFILRLLFDAPGFGVVWRIVAAVAAGWAMALLLVAPMVLPFLEYLLNSSTFYMRHEGADEEPPLDMYAIALFFIPRFFGAHATNTYWGDLDTNRHFMLYSGIACWVLLIPAIIGARTDRAHRTKLIALFVPAFLGVLLGFGVYPLRLLNNYPPLNALIPSYNVCFAVFAMPLAAAIGLDRIGRMPLQGKHLWGLGMIAGLGFIAVAWPEWMLRAIIVLKGEAPAHTRYMATAAILFAIGAVLLFAHRNRTMGAIGSAAFCVLLTVDLLIAGYKMNPTIPAEQVYPETELLNEYKENMQGSRLAVSEGGLPSGLVTTFLIEEVYGYDGLYPRRIIQYTEGLGADVWNAMQPLYSARYVMRDPAAPNYFPEDHADDWSMAVAHNNMEIWENPNAFPRSFIVPSVEVIEELDPMIDKMRDASFDPAQVALVDSPPPGTVDGGVGTAEIVERGIDHVIIDAESDGGAVLVLTDAYYPGWHASIDGAPAEIYPVYHAFRGVTIPEGSHRIEMKYDPMTFRIGIALSYATMLITTAIGFAILRRKKR